MEKFITTTDKATYEELLHRGFNLLSKADGEYIFVNDHKVTLDKNISNKITYTNKLFA